MKNLVVTSAVSPAGKTTVSAGLGSLLAEAGHSLRLLRLRSEESQDAGAEDDARALAAVPGCSSPGRALPLAEAVAQAEEASAGDAMAIVETPSGDGEIARRLRAGVMLCVAGAAETQLTQLRRLADTLGDALLGVMATAVPQSQQREAASTLMEAGLPCLAVLPEARLLAAPTIREMASALGANSLLGDGQEEEAVEYLMIGSVGADPGMPYFSQHGRKAVITRSEKTDLLLAALNTDLDCLILTGGHPPSPYVLDWIQNSAQEVAVLLTAHDTVATVRLLDELYGRARFAGKRKLECAGQILRERLDVGELLARLA
jgi:BioD-like phosphotransacetylase family protein